MGSNIRPREVHLAQARRGLLERGVHILRMSSVYESEPVDFLDQPCFLNQVVEVSTPLSPLSLLKTLKALEINLGRKESFPKGPRLIDIDILLKENMVFSHPLLVLPHPSLHKRRFILTALREIAPEIVHPVLKLSVDRLLQDVDDSSEVNIYIRRPGS